MSSQLGPGTTTQQTPVTRLHGTYTKGVNTSTLCTYNHTMFNKHVLHNLTIIKVNARESMEYFMR